jgi:hypothetical protein
MYHTEECESITGPGPYDRTYYPHVLPISYGLCDLCPVWYRTSSYLPGPQPALLHITVVLCPFARSLCQECLPALHLYIPSINCSTCLDSSTLFLCLALLEVPSLTDPSKLHCPLAILTGNCRQHRTTPRCCLRILHESHANCYTAITISIYTSRKILTPLWHHGRGQVAAVKPRVHTLVL